MAYITFISGEVLTARIGGVGGTSGVDGTAGSGNVNGYGRGGTSTAGGAKGALTNTINPTVGLSLEGGNGGTQNTSAGETVIGAYLEEVTEAVEEPLAIVQVALPFTYLIWEPRLRDQV